MQFGVDRLAWIAVLTKRELGTAWSEARATGSDQPSVVAKRYRDIYGVLDLSRLSHDCHIRHKEQTDG
jgi:hypothetical protein